MREVAPIAFQNEQAKITQILTGQSISGEAGCNTQRASPAGRPWREVTYVFLLSRAGLLLVSYLAYFLWPQIQRGIPAECGLRAACLYYEWDARGYAEIAYQGYSVSRDVVYFPLWPFVVHFGGMLAGGSYPVSYYLASIVLANVCFYGALLLLYRLLSRDFDPGIARLAVCIAAFYPYGIFFFAGYTESLFLLLTIACFLALSQQPQPNWWLAGGLGFLATLTRPGGAWLVVPLLWVALAHLRHETRWGVWLRTLLPLLLIPGAISLYMLYLALTKGDPLLFMKQEALYWHRQFTPPWQVAGMLWAHMQRVHDVWGWAEVGFTLLPLLLLLLSWRHLPRHYWLYALALALFLLCEPVHTGDPISSQPRYFMSLFPLFAALAYWGRRLRVGWPLVLLFALLFLQNTIFYISHQWVA